MSTSQVQRRLAAVVVVDVVGYSAMMARDEEGTLAALKAHRNETDPIVLNHGGRIVKGTGDGLLVEFPSAVEAVRAAIETQRLMAERNAASADDRRMEYRIGINLGDVIVDDDGDIYGDGVNIAARLEGAAGPGGICLSESIHRQVHGTVDAPFEPMGAIEVKNIPSPVEAWRIGPGPRLTRSGSGSLPGYSLPTIAVLPFDNLSGDPGENYFVDGLVEDLITALARERDLRIVSRNSTFAFKGRTGDIRDMARELDATYVVTGSARRAGGMVRVTAQLIEAESGHQVWAERYDRDLDDIFVVQDDVVAEIAGAIHPNVERAQGEKLERARPDELDAWDLVLRAKGHVYASSREGATEAIRLLDMAARRDPDLALVRQTLAFAWITVAFNSWPIPGRDPWEEMRRNAEHAYRLAPSDPASIIAYGFAEEYAGNLESARELAGRAVQIVPDDAYALTLFGQVMFFKGEFDGAIDHLTNAWRRARHEPWRFHISNSLAFAHYLAGRYEAAAAWAERTLQITDYLQTRAIYAATLGQLGRDTDARHQVAELEAVRPGVVAADFTRNARWARAEDVAHYHDGLVKAGLTSG
jgi:TolB-like protein/class 3 adenylate cyclase